MTNTDTADAAVLTVPEGAEYLRIGRNQMYEAIRRGEVHAIRIGRSLRIPRAELDRLLTVREEA